MELDGKGVDAVWNGMTLTDEVKTSMRLLQPVLRPTHRSLSFRPIRRTLPRIWTALRSCPSQLRLVPQALLPLMRSV